mmetsp:Transcript_19694/g.35008  ORF Transcript_19694/g.35008 Transcript_19694/m.35008 type:complete len:225 (-) Transcript_19694:98-772(-)
MAGHRRGNMLASMKMLPEDTGEWTSIGGSQNCRYLSPVTICCNMENRLSQLTVSCVLRRRCVLSEPFSTHASGITRAKTTSLHAATTFETAGCRSSKILCPRVIGSPNRSVITSVGPTTYTATSFMRYMPRQNFPSIPSAGSDRSIGIVNLRAISSSCAKDTHDKCCSTTFSRGLRYTLNSKVLPRLSLNGIPMTASLPPSLCTTDSSCARRARAASLFFCLHL